MDYNKPFEVRTDAWDFVIGVLMQEGHSVAYESLKLNKIERWYLVLEKEIATMVHCLRVRRHSLLET